MRAFFAAFYGLGSRETVFRLTYPLQFEQAFRGRSATLCGDIPSDGCSVRQTAVDSCLGQRQGEAEPASRNVVGLAWWTAVTPPRNLSGAEHAKRAGSQASAARRPPEE